MKRQLLLASASLIATVLASSAYAQDQTNISQTGTNGTFTVDQTGTNNVTGTVTDPSTGAGSAVIQTGVSNNLSVTQSGANNVFTGAPVTSDGSVVQTGTGNSADATQSGNGSKGTLIQGGTNNGVFNSQVAPEASPVASNVINQSANKSAVTLTQTGSNNTFDLVQGGTS